MKWEWGAALRTLGLLGICCLPLKAAPLFWGDEEARLWLRHYGIRATSRWEVAAQLAQLVNQLEKLDAEKLPKSALEELRQLLSSYRSELGDLGIRVGNLEERLNLVEQRTEELGRIRFSGRYRASYVSMGVQNTGSGALNYSDLAGSLEGANLTPLNPFGTQPVLDYSNGRPLVRGSGLSQVLLLNVEAEPAPDWLSELRVFAYSSQGNGLVDSLWGVQPPLQSNPFGQAVSPYSSAGLDRLSLARSDGTLAFALGSFSPKYMSPQVFTGKVNPRVGDPRLLESYGLQVTGELEDGRWGWEAFATQLFDGNPGVTEKYRSYALGASLQYHNQDFTLSLSGLRAFDDSQNRGQITNFNQLTGLGTLNWVNPPGFFAGQVDAAGVGSFTDQRPLAGLPGSDAGGPATNAGPQQISLAGLHAEYNPSGYSLLFDYSFSDYRPNRESTYSTRGQLWRLGGAVDIIPETWRLELDYRHTDARYDPMILQFGVPLAGQNPGRVYHRFPDFDQFWQFWSLHNTDLFPHNRRGFWLSTRYQYAPEGSLTMAYRNLSQVSTSLQDVRLQPNQLGLGLPNAPLLGFSPGFVDIVFREFSPLSFDSNLQPLENPRGGVQSFSAKVSHQFEDSPWKIEAGYENWAFRRNSQLAPAQGGSQNRVDLTNDFWKLAVTRKFGSDLQTTLGFQQARMRGHYDPGGHYNNFAIATNSVDFRNRDLVQNMPFVQFDWTVDTGIRVGAEAMLYSTLDRVPAEVTPGPANSPIANAHPFAWNGFRWGTTVEIDF